jgi:hypothetical protein
VRHQRAVERDHDQRERVVSHSWCADRSDASAGCTSDRPDAWSRAGTRPGATGWSGSTDDWTGTSSADGTRSASADGSGTTSADGTGTASADGTGTASTDGTVTASDRTGTATAATGRDGSTASYIVSTRVLTSTELFRLNMRSSY